jgi:hypothetical protein
MKNNFFIKIFLCFLIIVVSFIGFKTISIISKHSEQMSINSGLIGGTDYEEAKDICNKEKIVRKITERNVRSLGYKLYIQLENGKILLVDGEQFQKASEGNECRTIF